MIANLADALVVITELEERLRRWETGGNNMTLDRKNEQVACLEQENQRYREALEAIADGTFEEWEMAGVAKKALRGIDK